MQAPKPSDQKKNQTNVVESGKSTNPVIIHVFGQKAILGKVLKFR